MSDELFIRIYDWMFDILKGNDLIVFALIYSLGEVTGQKYITERTRINARGVIRSIRTLEEMKLIEKVDHSINNLTTWRLCQNVTSGYDKMSPRMCQNVITDMTKCHNRHDKMSHPFLYNTNIDTNTNTNKHTNHHSVILADILSSLSIQSDPELEDAIQGFIEHRKKLKKPMTDHALELNIKKAHKLSGGDAKGMTELFNLAVEKGWQGIYPEKKEGGKNDTGKHEKFFK